MAERGRGAAGGALPSSPGPVLAAKGALRAGAGEGGGGGRPGPGRARCDSAGVSNGDCSLGAPGGEARVGPALAAAPGPAACPLPRDSKPGGLPRRSSIIKVGGRGARVARPPPSGGGGPSPGGRTGGPGGEPPARGNRGCAGGAVGGGAGTGAYGVWGGWRGVQGSRAPSPGTRGCHLCRARLQ
ncbi:unnamed protein product [Rangifer tarandus platyrhynchus]|uniref:Uncharacterized protein n=1 Tax=Rangifer tarandus platyrhynchus TaxID=3082113 RepID=A0ABN8ZVE0_RANTA|nr:unnamed protein product [Rangifer tarandus platyrhynchus]